jgi:beta-glucosidase
MKYLNMTKRRITLVALSVLVMSAAAVAQTSAPVAKVAQNDEAKIDALIKQLTLEEKVNMIHASSSFTSGGVKRLGIPELTTSDGPHGVRPEHGRDWTLDKDLNDSGTYLPTGVALASTWNPQLGYAFGSVLGSEANARGKDVILGPGINIMRTPLNGRNFEYQSEDPYLISQMVVGYIKGVQDQGVSACVKHFIANNQETNRNTVDIHMSERALREIYLPGFKAAVTVGKVNTIMGAYNLFRGQYCTENDYLINKILKGEWKFDGLVMSDWGAVHVASEALLNGCDLEMGTDLKMLPNPDYNKFYMADSALLLVKSGKVPESVIDEKVRRILRVMYRTHMFDKREPGSYATKEHAATALKIAEESIVLLKNEKSLLPLSAAAKNVAVIGMNADRKNSMGGGSSQVKALYEITPLAGLKTLMGDKVNFTYSQGYKIERKAEADDKLIAEAVAAAKKSDVAIVFGGWTHGYSDYSKWSDNAFDAEGFDKKDMKMPFGQDKLIQAVLKANPNTIVVLIGGGPIDMTQWIGQTKAVVQAWYGGMESGTAIAEMLYGKINPSGKLPVTFPKVLEDVPAHKLGEYGTNLHEEYKDGIYVGYRYYDTYKVQPQFAFGHGLSYTTFSYSNLTVTKNSDNTVSVNLTVKNTGSKDGGDVAQVYVHQDKCSVDRPEKELKGFEKVFLKAGESKELKLTLTKDAFQYFDDKKNDWTLEPGKFTILVGNASDDIKVKGAVVL